MSIPLFAGLAAMTIIGIVLFGRRDDPDRPRRRHRDIPGLPDDGGPLHCWEWDEIDRIEDFYADTAHDPMARRNTTRRGRG